MRKYDYTFLKNDIPNNIVRLTNIVFDLNARESFRKINNQETFESLRKKAVIESVKGSNAIEGIITTENRLKELINGDKPVSHDEKEILGYKNALNYIYENNNEIDINEETIMYLHSCLTNVNTYKEKDNYIMEYDSVGNRRIRFTPVKANEVKESINQLLLAFYDARQDEEIIPLLLIPCFILDFLCIHPFNDGNGRVSRLLTLMLLNSFGYDVVRFISFEAYINKHKDAYYEALEKSSINWHDNKNDYVPFIVNFLQTLYGCYKQLDETFMDISLGKVKKHTRIENILLNSIVPISKQDIKDKLPDVNIKTIELTLSKMLKEEKIIKIGTFKDARYKKK